MAKVNWIQDLVIGEVTTDRRVVVEVRNMEPMTTLRPRTVEESGADPAMLDRIRKRIPGPINTLGFIGGGYRAAGAVLCTVPASRAAHGKAPPEVWSVGSRCIRRHGAPDSGQRNLEHRRAVGRNG